MSRAMYVFVRRLGNIKILLSELSVLFAVPYDSITTDYGPIFRFRVLGQEIDVFNEHGLEDDCGIEFSKYPLEIRIQSLNLPVNATLLAQIRENIALLVAEVLVSNLSCEYVIADNLQQKIATNVNT